MDYNIQKYADKWGLILEKEIKTSSGIVCLGRRGDLLTVLKLPHPNADEAQQKNILQHFNSNGAIKVISADGAVMLLERLSPGYHVAELTKAGYDNEATRIFCGITRQLHAAKSAIENFKPVTEFVVYFDRYLESGDGKIAAQEVRYAKELYMALIASQAKPVLLHGDLHHDNILSDDVRGWIAIDPKGYVAEPAYEARAWIRNPVQYIHQIASREAIEQRVAIMVGELEWSRERILRWSYAQAILSAIWLVEDGGIPDDFLTIATALKEMI